MESIMNRLHNIGIVPVVKISNEIDSLPIAKSLLDGGIDTMEITFRSDHAIYAMKEISKAYPEILVGAGTVSSVAQAKEAVEAGCKFIVTPGFNTQVVEWCIENNVVIIPGIGTPTEIETALAYGITSMKLFPAATMGGDKFIKDISGPYPQVKIMPTGGISVSNMHDYLKLKSVIAIGGSFMLPNDLIESKDWDALKDLSENAIKEMLDLRVEKVASHLIHSNALKLVKDTVFESDSEVLVLSTPYLDRALYHIQKTNPEAVLTNGSITITNDKGIQILIKERN